MLFDFDQLTPNQRYHIVTQTVTPRPIAWILTKNEESNFNLAPFSYFSALGSDPAIFVVSIGNKSQHLGKDTKTNLMRERECVLHIPSESLANSVNLSAASLDYGQSEVEANELELSSFTDKLPRLNDAKIAFHCRLYDIHPVGESSFDACYLEVVSVYVDDEAIRQDGDRTYIDSDIIRPLGRLGGNDFALYGGKMTLKRPN